MKFFEQYTPENFHLPPYREGGQAPTYTKMLCYFIFAIIDKCFLFQNEWLNINCTVHVSLTVAKKGDNFQLNVLSCDFFINSICLINRKGDIGIFMSYMHLFSERCHPEKAKVTLKKIA